jgi:hypothetical protein
MNRVLIFISGFVAGVLATIFVGYFIVIANKPMDDGMVGLTVFSKTGECLKTTSQSKSMEIEIFQVIEPNTALAKIKNYDDKKIYDGEIYRDYDIANEIIVLLINYDDKAYYDDQKIDVTNKCIRQIGTYQYATKTGIEKTVPAVLIE